jgi:hypothetical protein
LKQVQPRASLALFWNPHQLLIPTKNRFVLNEITSPTFCNSRFPRSIQRRRIRGELEVVPLPNSADELCSLLPIEVI